MAPYPLLSKTTVCRHCSKEFSRLYFKRHKCIKQCHGATKHENQAVVENNIQEEKFESNPSTESNTPKQEFHLQEEAETVHTDSNCDASSSVDNSSSTDDDSDEIFYETSDSESEDDDDSTCTAPNITSSQKINIFSLLLLLWQLTFHVPRRAMVFLLKLFRFVLESSAIAFSEKSKCDVPRSVYHLNSLFKQDVNYKKFVVCVDCYKLYDFDDCWILCEGKKISKCCDNVVFPNHKLAHYRQPCSSVLLTSIITSKGPKLVPKKTYMYIPIEQSLRSLVQTPGFETRCEEWRKRTVDERFMTDLYDGQIWKDFTNNGYLKTDGNLAIVLNVDWFQPFTHVNYSVGAVYAAVLNLPREERFNRENIFLIGLIPNFSKAEDGEPPLNNFLRPLVDELKRSWYHGFEMNSFNSPNNTKVYILTDDSLKSIDVSKINYFSQKFKIAVLMAGCDLPAKAKLCGFMGHSAKLGCSRCYKEFFSNYCFQFTY